MCRVYTKASTVSQEGFFHPYVDTKGSLRARTIGTCPADLTTCRLVNVLCITKLEVTAKSALIVSHNHLLSQKAKRVQAHTACILIRTVLVTTQLAVRV